MIAQNSCKHLSPVTHIKYNKAAEKENAPCKELTVYRCNTVVRATLASFTLCTVINTVN